MKPLTFASTIIILFSAAVSCDDDDKESRIILKADYCSTTSLDCTSNYPLVSGYLKKNNTESYEITGDQSIDSKNYFVWSVKSQTAVTEYYERLESNKLFARYNTSGGSISEEFMAADFNADVNYQWPVDNYYDQGSAILKIESKSTNVTIKNTTFNNAIKISIDFPGSGDYSEYYLPGLGFVKGNSELYEFHIGGKVYIIE